MELRFVDAENTDLLELAGRLDEYYFSIVGEVHRRYAKYNDPHLFGCRLVVYEDGCAAGIPSAGDCGRGHPRAGG